MNFYTDAPMLSLPLPEDIAHLKHFGDFERMNRVIDLRLADENVPECVKTRLRLEKEICARIPGEYPYDTAAACAMLAEELEGFTPEELERFRDEGKVDWIYLNGEVRYHCVFLETLVKVRPELADRVIKTERLAYKKRNFAALDAVIRDMRQNGGAAYRWHVRHTLALKPECERPGAMLTAHIPLPVEGGYVKNFKLLDAGPVRPYLSEGPQRTACFRKPCEPGDVFRVEYSFETHMTYRRLDPALATGEIPPEAAAYLTEQPPHIAFTPLVKAVAAELRGTEANPLRLARRVYDFLTKRPIYSYVREYFTYTDLPGFMLTSLKGDCGIFALSFIALCRALGIPARWESGMYCAPHDLGSHDWAEFYCAPWGWLPVDGSFGNAAWRAGSQLRHDFYFGNLEPFRLPAARAFQAPLDPPKRFLRADPYDNQSGEMEYEDMGLIDEHYSYKREVLGWERIEVKRDSSLRSE